jgi:signal peptide peptidase SppA
MKINSLYAMKAEELRAYMAARVSQEKMLLRSDMKIGMGAGIDLAQLSQLMVVSDFAVCPVVGVLEKSAMYEAVYYSVASYERIMFDLSRAQADPKVAGVVLYIDSPGGAVDGVLPCAELIAGMTKPCIAVVNGMAASGAYWLASQCKQIIMGQLDFVGSIGVKQVLYDDSEAFKQAGVKVIAIDTGDYKSTGEPGLPITEEQVADMQKLVDTAFTAFKDAVIAGRPNIDKEVFDGRVFMGEEAVKLGLADSVGYLEQGYQWLLGVTAGRNRTTPNMRRAAERKLLQMKSGIKLADASFGNGAEAQTEKNKN